jgi:hypothetical protein
LRDFKKLEEFQVATAEAKRDKRVTLGEISEYCGIPRNPQTWLTLTFIRKASKP